MITPAWGPPVNVHSQYGEDGVLEWVCKHLGLTNSSTFVEFGAWDGKFLSNCRSLFEQGWRGVFIEGDARRFQDLLRNYGEEQDRVTPIHAFVEISGENCLDNILQRARVEDVDLLSIDIDSDDLAVWRSVEVFRPAVVIIEFNPTIPFDTRYENPPGRNHGNSALSLLELGDQKGYDLVAGTDANLVFVDRARRPEALPVITLQYLKDSVGGGFRYFFCFDGTFLREASHTIRETEVYEVPWTRIIAPQPVPRFLRRFDENLGFQRLYSAFMVAITRPLTLIRAVAERRGAG